MLERSRILVIEDNIELQGIIADFLEVKEAIARPGWSNPGCPETTASSRKWMKAPSYGCRR